MDINEVPADVEIVINYAWIIDNDHQADLSAPMKTNAYATGKVGPRNTSDELVKELNTGKGERFRMLDDDGEIYYTGRIVGTYTGFEPLEDFGMPNAGCTTIHYKTSGAWMAL